MHLRSMQKASDIFNCSPGVTNPKRVLNQSVVSCHSNKANRFVNHKSNFLCALHLGGKLRSGEDV